MTLKGVTDEQRGKIYKKINAIIDRTGEGKSLDFDFVMKELQSIHDGLSLFDPHKFFVNRTGLCVSERFRGRILSVAKKTKKVSLGEVGHFDLPKPMSDAEIQKELGEGHVFEDAGEFCSFLAGLIDQQTKGEEGILITSRYVNIFYVRGKDNEVFAVNVRWYADGRGWDVDAYRLDDDQWNAGYRAFSRNGHLAK